VHALKVVTHDETTRPGFLGDALTGIGGRSEVVVRIPYLSCYFYTYCLFLMFEHEYTLFNPS